MATYDIQNQDIALLGSAASPKTLTGSYTTNGTNDAIAPVGYIEQAILYVGYTMGTAETSNSIQIKVEFAPDASTPWYRETTESISTGTRTLSLAEYTFAATQAAGTYDYVRIPVPVGDAYMHVSVKETGIAANGGKCFIRLALSGA